MNKRRKRQQYLLEVKVHREGQSRQRLHRVGAVLGALLLLAGTGYGLYRGGKWAANRLVFENPRFIIAQIVVENDGVLDPHLVARFAGVAVGQNLLGVDLEQARRNLELVPLIGRADVRRVMPGRLVIRVEERVPVARLQAPGREWREQEFYVDRHGVVMKPVKLTDGTVIRPQTRGGLPLLTGVTLADLQVGRKVESEQIYRALELATWWEQSPVGTMLEAERIDLTKPQELVLTTRQGTVVQLNVEDFAPQLRRLGVIMVWAQQRQRGVRTVDLTVSRTVPVTFVN